MSNSEENKNQAMCDGAWKNYWPALGLLICASAFGQTSNDRPLLQELDRQTQSLYRQASQSVVRVQLPTTRRSAGTDSLARWNSKLNPEIRARLEQARQPGTGFVAEILPTTQPLKERISTRAMTTPSVLPGAERTAGIIAPNVIGIIVDNAGDALLPTFADKADVGDAPFPVLMSDGAVVQAVFVGSDRQSNLTVIKIARPGLVPLKLGPGQPPEGAIVLAISIDPAATHTGVWSRWVSNWGLVVRTDGTLAGFSGRGQFLTAASCIPVAQQLIDHGHVDRPRLGIVIKIVGPDDPQRQFDPTLGQTPALRIFQVLADSPAARGGLRTGDLILSLAGQPVGDTASFASAIAQQRGPTDLQVLRQDQPIKVTVNLESQPSN